MPTASRLDRLTSLLTGLMPRIQIRHLGDLADAATVASDAADCLHLHLVVAGSVEFDSPKGTQTLTAPAIAVFRNDQAHGLRPVDDVTCRVFCAEAFFDGPAAPLLLEAFDAPLFLPMTAAMPGLTQTIGLIALEVESPRCGGGVLLSRAGEILLIGLLRHLLSNQILPRGVLAGLADPGLARALVAVHSQPAAPWSLEAMAETAGVSRTTFAERFRDSLGITPRRYLNAFRLTIARREIAAGRGLKRAAQAAGYESPAALSRALSRVANESGTPSAA
ncbi:MAG: AraC family transcriptional regulator [Denitromonas halophila]|nr:MAG: AraC family transcriptional regulator [Denitromonas halophila]TVT69430.1 MAG: AraC family transcriptional regulator [Denitromonas halophila]